METKSKMITIFTQKLAGWLMYNGFVLVGMSENTKPDSNGRNVFYFNDSEELRQVINNYKDKNKNKQK